MAEFKPDVGSQVLKTDAVKWRDDYQRANPGKTKSVFYGRQAIEAILADTTLTGISFIFCKKKNDQGVEYDDLVMVGTKLDGTLVWNNNPPSQTLSAGGGSSTYENSYPCPPYCPK
jgi:hypothetical protein